MRLALAAGFVLFFLFFVGLGAGQRSANAQKAAPLAIDDAYTVYSTVLFHPVWDHVDDGKLLLIAKSTGQTYGGMDPQICIVAPEKYKTQLAEVLADYTARKSVQEQLRPEFHVNRPYRLLTDTEADQFRDLRFTGKPSTPVDPALAEIFKKTPDLIRLSPVFFDKAHTLALVLVSNYCGGLCGGERWRVLLKQNGVWADQNWVGCMVIS